MPLNEFSESILLSGSSDIQQHGCDFQFSAHIVELSHDSTGLSFAF